MLVRGFFPLMPRARSMDVREAEAAAAIAEELSLLEELLPAGGANGIFTAAEDDVDEGCPIRLTLNDRGCALPSPFGPVGAWTGLLPFDRPPPVTPLRCTTNPLEGVGGASTPANMLPLAAASAAFLALFSSIASSAISSTDFFLPSPSAFFQPFFSSLSGLGAGSNACGCLLRRGGPGSSSDSSAWDDSVSSPFPNQPPALDFRLPALPLRARVGDEYCESGE